MKTILSTLLLASSLTLHAADIVCADYSGGLYPVSQDAVKLATHLRVTKCDGKRYKTAIKVLGEKITTVDATPAMIKQIEEAKEAKRLKQVTKKLSGFSF